MRVAAVLMAALALSGCVAQVGEEGGLRATGLISPIGIAVVPVYVPQPVPVPAPAPRPGWYAGP